MRVSAIAIENLPPFAKGLLEFPHKSDGSRLAEAHLFTGQNGTGKTRILSLLAAALGNSEELKIRTHGQPITAGVEGSDGQNVVFWTPESGGLLLSPSSAKKQTIEDYLHSRRLSYDTQMSSLIGRPDERKNLKWGPIAAMAFRGGMGISDAEVKPLDPIKIKDLADLLSFEKKQDEDRQVGQSLVNIKMAAAMDNLESDELANTRATRLSAKIEDAITKITNRKFRFSITPYPNIRIRVNWGGVTMRFSQMPDGLRSILGWMVACVAKLDALFPEVDNPLELPVILLLDEPESNLHPAWQRKLLPAAQSLFPNGQMFIATHSPFIISSINEGWIHIFNATEKGVIFEQPRECSKGDSYMEVIEDVLGVKEWYDPESETLLTEFRHLKENTLSGDWSKEDLLRNKAEEIAGRSESLEDLIGGEMAQFERLKTKARINERKQEN